MRLRWLKSELISQPARKLFGWIESERTSAVQGALPAVSWEIFPMFGKLDDEITFLRAENYLQDLEPRVQTLTAFDRFSIRA